jgi:copper chaperone CopZ
MRRFLLIPILILAMASAAQAATARFDVQGMVCESCAEDIKASLAKLAGIRAVSIDISTAQVTVHYDDRKADPRAIIKAIDGYGFVATLIPAKPTRKNSPKQAK